MRLVIFVFCQSILHHQRAYLRSCLTIRFNPFCGFDAQVPCGYVENGQPCAASVCLEQMAAHYKEAHDAETDFGYDAKINDDGSKLVQFSQNYIFPNNKGVFLDSRLCPTIFKPVVGGCYVLDLIKIGPKELRFGVRQLGRGPSRHRLASATVRFGPADGKCFQFPLSRALAADERVRDAALRVGTPPAVESIDPAFLARALVFDTSVPRPDEPWELEVSVSLVFQVVEGE